MSSRIQSQRHPGTQLVEVVLGKGFLDLPAFNLAEIIAKDTR